MDLQNFALPKVLIVEPSKVLVSILMASSFFWICIYLLVPVNTTRLVSLVVTFLCGVISLSSLCFYFRKIRFISLNSSFWVISLFLLRSLYGIIHYLVLVDNNYFSSNESYKYLHDYEWLENSMVFVSDHWIINGFGLLTPEFMVSNKNAILTSYMSLLYYLGGNYHFLNIVFFNSIHAIFVSLLVSSIALSISKNKLMARNVLIIALFQPFGFASDIFWRDSVGQFLVVASITILLYTRPTLKGFGLFILASLLAFMHRTTYVVICVIVYSLSSFWLKNKREKQITKWLILFVFSMFLFLYGNDISELIRIEHYLEKGGSNTAISKGGSIYTFILGFVGPFPWYQIFNPAIVGREYLLYDMLQASYCMVIYFVFIQQLITKKISEYTKVEKLLLFSVIFYMSFGLFSYGYISYVTVATPVLLGLITNLSLPKFAKKWMISIFCYIVLSLIWSII